MRAYVRSILVAAFLAVPASAQQSLLFALDHSGSFANGGVGIALGEINDQDINIVTPTPGGPPAPYWARKFHNVAAWRCVMGDSIGFPGSLSYANGSPVSEIDGLQLAPDADLSDGVQLADLWVSFNNNVLTLPSSGIGFADQGEMLQFLPGGQIVRKVTRIQINTLIGQPVNNNVDIDGFALSAAGDFYYSDSQNQSTGAAFAMLDGGVWMAPAGNWSTSGTALAGGAFVILLESEVDALVANATGNAFTACSDLKGLEIDPNGGTWTASRRRVIAGVLTPFDVVQLPNLLFGASSVGGAIFSTANGGSAAVINGATIGGPPLTAWNNLQLGPAIGIQPAPVAQPIGDFALIPAQQNPLLCDYKFSPTNGADPLGNTPTPGILPLDIGDTAPNGLVNLVATSQFGGGLAPGGLRFPSIGLPGYEFGELFLDITDPLFALTFLDPSFTYATDIYGFVQVNIQVPPGLNGLAAVVQAIDLVDVRLGGPAPIYFN